METYQSTLHRAHRHFGAGELQDAVQLCRKLLQRDPQSVGALHLMGRILGATGQFEESLRWLDRAQKLAPDEPEIVFDQALTLQESGQLEAAVSVWQKGLALNAEVVEAWTHLGVTLYELSRYAESEASYLRAIALAPEDATTHFNRGLALEAMQRFADARAAYQEAETLDPMDVDAVLRLIEVNLALDRPTDAIAALLRARDLRPGDLDLRARLNRLTAQWPAARPQAERYARRLLSSADRWTNAALAADRRGDRSAAIAALGRALQRDDQHPAARHLYDAFTGKTSPAPPPGYVQKLFDDYAERFEEHLVSTLHYRLPEAMRDLQRRLSLPASRMLDLGCGTGLVGQAFREVADDLVGVDLSPKMIELCARKGIYDELHQADVVAWLSSDNARFHLITAADLLIYIGAVELLFQAAAARLRDGGGVLLSIERLEGEGYTLRDSGRYAHSRAYIGRAAASASLRIGWIGAVDIRKTPGGWESGDLILLQPA